MQKIFFSILILSFLIVGTGVLAQNDELPSPGITPDSPFYFLERIVEKISTFFIFGDLKKAERHALLAAERLAEAQAIAEKGKPELIEKTSARYENQLEKSMARIERAIRKGENTEKIMEVLDRVGQATSKHLEVLAEVYEKAPEQAKPAVENAMKVSVKRHEKAVEVLKAKNALGEITEEVTLPAQVPEEVRERIQREAQEELEQEKIERIKEQIFKESFESFEAIEAFCIEVGGSPEQCAEAEAMCKEVGATTPGECSRDFFIPTIRRIPATEEQMEEARIKKEAQEEFLRKIEAERAEAESRKKAADELFEQGIIPE